ncbi:MAG TPA: type II toxin-antitoxin system prevent-host-death family antitoxin [Candidatus Paceibacterota bacterium]
MDKIIGLKELRRDVARYAREVERGKSFIIIRRSKPLFRIAPVEEGERWEPVVDFTKLKRGGVSIKDVVSRL